jgi:hypothetical protein
MAAPGDGSIQSDLFSEHEPMIFPSNFVAIVRSKTIPAKKLKSPPEFTLHAF